MKKNVVIILLIFLFGSCQITQFEHIFLRTTSASPINLNIRSPNTFFDNN